MTVCLVFLYDTIRPYGIFLCYYMELALHQVCCPRLGSSGVGVGHKLRKKANMGYVHGRIMKPWAPGPGRVKGPPSRACNFFLCARKTLLNNNNNNNLDLYSAFQATQGASLKSKEIFFQQHKN